MGGLCATRPSDTFTNHTRLHRHLDQAIRRPVGHLQTQRPVQLLKLGRIRTLQRRLKTTSVYVTHDQLEAMTLADRLVVMNAGHIEQVGTPTELYERPATLFVAGFIGSPPMNIIPVSALQPADSARFGQAANIGIRPDALSLTQSPNALALEATVALIEPIGAESHVHIRWNGKPLVAQMHEDVADTRAVLADLE